MAANLQPSLLARNGHTLKVLGIARISTVHQDAKSLEDQEQLYRKWLNQNTDLPYDLQMIASRGSGEVLDRKEYLLALEYIEANKLRSSTNRRPCPHFPQSSLPSIL